MTQLAKQHDGNTITRLEEVAQREDVSANFLVQILNDLRRDSLIISKRGKMGGYLLASDPKKITLYDIVHAVEPAILAESITSEGESGQAVSDAWKLVSDVFIDRLKDITLDTLSDGNEGAMFYI